MNEQKGRTGLSWPERIQICEVGPRDGLQNEKVSLATETKIQLIERAAEAGADSIEIGSFVHPKAVPQMADTDEVARRMKRYPQVEYRALVFNVKGLERAEAAGISKVKLTVSASVSHSLSNANRTPQEAVSSFRECADYAAIHGLELSGAIATTFGCPFEGRVPLEQVLKVVASFWEIGVKEISLSDTTGMANPRQVYEYCRLAQREFPDIVWSLHFHNTRGLGLVNAAAGMLAGVTRYDASFAGLGGCPFAPGATGNIASEDLVNMCQEMGIKTGYNLDSLISLGHYIRELVGRDTGSFILKAGKCTDIQKPFVKRQ